MPTVQAHVLYPNDDDTKFDLDYYLATHMPLVEKKWAPMGLKGWQVTKITTGQNNTKPPYSVGAILDWESEEALLAALEGEDAKAIFGDIPNFTNSHPTLFAGGVVKAFGTLSK